MDTARSMQYESSLTKYMEHTSSGANSFSGTSEIPKNYGTQRLIIVFRGNVPSNPGMQVRKLWCLLSSNWVGLGNTGVGGATIFETF
jgi:hypothetical protein